MKKWLLILLFSFQFVSTNGQNIERGLLPIYSIQSERITRINSIDEDKLGFLWLATDKGLYTFDGNTLSRFDKTSKNLRKAYYTHLIVDSKNRVWAGTISKGLICIEDSRNIIKEYAHHPNDIASLADNRIKLIFEDYKGNIWVATHTSGINKLNTLTNDFKHFFPSKLFSDKDKRNIDEFISHRRDPKQKNIEWLGTLDGLLKLNVDDENLDLYYCDETTISKNSILNGLENQIRNINFTSEGMFLGTWGGGICKLDTIDNIWDSYKFESPLIKSHTKNNTLYGIVNKKNKLIYSIFNKGTLEYDSKSKSLTPISSSYLDIYFSDSKNQEWFVFEHSKLFVRTQKGKLFKLMQVPQEITAYYHDKENKKIYTGIYNKPQLIITDEVTHTSKTIEYKPIHNNGNNWIYDIYTNPQGELIIHENRDLYVLKNEKLSLFFDLDQFSNGKKFSDNSTLCSYIDSNDEIWMGYKELGILRINTKTPSHILYNEKNGIIHSGWISTFFEDNKNRIWFGTEKSLSYFDKKDQKFYNIFDSLRAFDYINTITQDPKENIWVGEENNILKINLYSKYNYDLKTIIPPENIGRNISIHKIDSLNNLWGSSSKGIFYYNTKKNTFKFWGNIYGFKAVKDIDFCGKDTMIVVTFYGLLKGNKKDLFESSIKGKIDFAYLKLFNKDYNYDNKHFNEIDKINLKYKQNFITIGFSLKQIIDPEELYFEYKLEGLRDEWIPLGNRNFIEFSHLNPGNYKLQVRQITIGNSPVVSKKLSIIIQTPFWKTVWFNLLLVGLIGILLFMHLNSKKKKMQIEFDKEVAFQKKLANVEMMALKSQMNPHFVFNCLNTIKLFVLENKTEKASKYISDFAKLLRIALNDSRVDLTLLSNELESVRLYIELEKMRFEQKFDYVISYPKNIDLSFYKVPPMLLQPFVENAIQHGILPSPKTGKLNIDIKKIEGYFIYTILDNGIGRKASQSNKSDNILNSSLGINITNDRLKLIQTIYGMEASINIYDLVKNGVAQGTKVVVKIPIIVET